MKQQESKELEGIESINNEKQTNENFVRRQDKSGRRTDQILQKTPYYYIILVMIKNKIQMEIQLLCAVRTIMIGSNK
jgi:hypothetical protein